MHWLTHCSCLLAFNSASSLAIRSRSSRFPASFLIAVSTSRRRSSSSSSSVNPTTKHTQSTKMLHLLQLQSTDCSLNTVECTPEKLGLNSANFSFAENVSAVQSRTQNNRIRWCAIQQCTAPKRGGGNWAMPPSPFWRDAKINLFLLLLF